MKLKEEQRGAHTILRIVRHARARRRTRALCRSGSTKSLRESGGALILDMSGLEHLDSTAIGVLVGGLKRFEAQGRRFYLVTPRERVASVFRITHLDSVFRVFPTVDAALAVGGPAPAKRQTSEH